MRLVLFDVDGTLLSASGAGRRALSQALSAVYGFAGPIETYDFRGKTDPQIVFDLMTAAGLTPERIALHLERCFTVYSEALKLEIQNGSRVTLMPGVAELVRRLSEHDEVVVGLLTGNVEAGARIKLEPTGLLPRFRVGAYGSDHADRTELPAIAAGRAEELLGCRIRPGQVMVIGDTPLDIQCARAFGARAVAVATGHHSLEELAAHGPDALFPNLSDVAAVMAALLR
jgi:phosphoglycolate phosphatase-like HAD superfamily hydrolase